MSHETSTVNTDHSTPPMVDGEVVVRLTDGWSLRSSDDELVSGGYVRLCRPDSSEYAFWTSDEWRDEPVLVMGAIINAAAGFRTLDIMAPTGTSTATG